MTTTGWIALAAMGWASFAYALWCAVCFERLLAKSWLRELMAVKQIALLRDQLSGIK